MAGVGQTNATSSASAVVKLRNAETLVTEVSLVLLDTHGRFLELKMDSFGALDAKCPRAAVPVLADANVLGNQCSKLSTWQRLRSSWSLPRALSNPELRG